MKLKKISCIVAAMALTLGLFTIKASATEKSNRAIIVDSVVINKGDGSVVIPSNKVLETLNENTLANEKGSLTIKLSDTSINSSKAGVKFSISQIADIKNGEYVVKDQYSNVEVDLNNIRTANDLELAAELFKEVAITDNTIESNNNGECSIDSLDVGVYLVYASDIADYDNITPFIISIPSWNEADKNMSYDIEVIPKHTEIPNNESNKVPATGYSNKSIIYLGIGGICLVGSAFLFLGAKKTERN